MNTQTDQLEQSSSGLLERGCKCLSIIKDKLEKHHGGEVELELKQYMVQDPEATEYQFVAGAPPLFYKYKDGKKWRKSHLAFSFCPFCGKPI